MTHTDYIIYIRRQLANKPILYQLGYLQAQLARAMLNDSKVAYSFKHSIEQHKDPKQ